MNKTQNYQLSQWERTDKVLMDDFNGDNAKIDSALGEHAAALAAQAGLLAKRGELHVPPRDLHRHRRNHRRKLSHQLYPALEARSGHRHR